MQTAVVSEVITDSPVMARTTWEDPGGWAFRVANDPRSRIPSNASVVNFISISFQLG
jgi:hypothetical protein